jgi:hypothetical protein
MVSLHYASARKDAAQLVFDPDPLRQEPQDGKEMNFGGQLILNLPIHLEGLDPKARLNAAGLQVTADVPGFRYQSAWLPGGLSGATTTLVLPQDVVHKLEKAPAHLHLILVGDRLMPGNPESAAVASRFEIPGATCLLSDDGVGGPFCHYAYHNPQPTEIAGKATEPPCAADSPAESDVAEIRSTPQTPSLDPVDIEELRMPHGVLCAGAPLTLTAYHPAGPIRAEVDVPALSLGAYVRRNHPVHAHLPPTEPEAPSSGSGKPAAPAERAPAPARRP